MPKQLPPIAVVLVTAALTVASPAQITPATPPPLGTIHIRIARPASPVSIPNTVFGSFLEPIGRSTYGGLWANVVDNPSLEPGLWSTANIDKLLKDQPDLRHASDLALPLPWLPLEPGQGARYLPVRGDAANSDQSLLVMGLPGKDVGIRQRVYLPTHRELTYTGSLWAKHVRGNNTVTVSLLRHNHPDQILAHATLEAPATTWVKLPFSLTLQSNAVAPLEPVDLAISLHDDTRILLDNIDLVPADAIDGMDPEVLTLARDLHSPLIRFGGNFTSGYDWHDGVGPEDKRVSMRNASWGIPEYNTFGTDEFLAFCRYIHAQPQVALNLGSGTPQQAADWVRYIDGHWADHKGGLLWELGNELWGDWQIGYPTLDEVGPLTGSFAQAVHAVDPSARLIATGGVDQHFSDWNAKQLANPVGSFSYLSTHYVVGDEVALPHPTQDFRTMADLALPIGLEDRVRGIRQQALASPNGHDVKVAFTEWLLLSSTHQGPSYTNMGGALFAASFLNMILRNSDIVPVSDMTGILEFAGIWQRRGQVYATPAYWTLRTFANAEPKTALTVISDGPTFTIANGIRSLADIKDVPYLDLAAALSADGHHLLLFATNRDLTRPLTAQLDLSALGVPGSGTAHITTLQAENILVENDEEDPNRVLPSENTIEGKGSSFTHTFPNASVTLISIPIR